jgi:hypothetical protein
MRKILEFNILYPHYNTFIIYSVYSILIINKLYLYKNYPLIASQENKLIVLENQ